MVAPVADERKIYRRVGYRLGLSTSFQEESNDEYRAFQDIYTDKRRALLAQHYWGFAMGEAMLQPIVSTSVFFPYSHQLPADFIAPNYLNRDGRPLVNDLPYQPAGDRINSPFERIYLNYTKDVEQTNYFSPLFLEALILAICMEMCLPFGQDKEHLDRLSKAYDELKFESIQIENRTVDDGQIVVDNFDQARRNLNMNAGYEGGTISRGAGDFTWPPVVVSETPLRGTPKTEG